MRTHLLIASLMSVNVFAIPPSTLHDEKQKEVEADLQKACNSKTKISIDWASFDDASMSPTFGPHLSCFEFAKAVGDICKNSSNPGYRYPNAGGDRIDEVPLRELTELRCMLDRKHEDALNAWVKSLGKKGKRGDTPPPEAKLFNDLPSPNDWKGKSAWPTAAITFSGPKMTVAFTRESATTFVAVTVQVAASVAARARAAQPGYEARRKQVLEAAAGAAASALRSVDPGDAREGDARLKPKLDEANEKCGTRVTATIDWAGVKIPDDTYSTAHYAEKFAGMCLQAIEGFGYACDDDGVKGRVARAVKAISCKFDKKAYDPKSGTYTIIKLEGGTLTVFSDWESANHEADTQRFLTRKL